MRNFFEQLGRFTVRLVIISLILLISYQMLIGYGETSEGLMKLERFVGSFFARENEVLPVSGNEIEGESGEVVVDLMQDLSLPGVWLLKNNKKAANFRAGVVAVEVKEGDLLSIDAQNYNQPLWFEVRPLTTSIITWGEKEKFRTNGNILGLGIVKFAGNL